MVAHPKKIMAENETCRILFPLLAKRNLVKGWAGSADPLSGLRNECLTLAANPQFTSEFKCYIDAHPIIQASCESMLAQLALPAGVRWQDTDPILHPLSRRGWYIGRWLPTFLLISGPLGRLLKDPASPLNKRLLSKNPRFPFLSEARDAFNDNTFRLLRNGFGHWSFEWIDSGHLSGVEVKIIDWVSGKETTRLSLLECEAFHFLTFCVVRTIDREIFATIKRMPTIRPDP